MTISVCDGRLIKMTVATALLATVAQPGFGQDLKYKPIAVKTPDGLTISAQEWGNPAGAEILFIHGFSQSHLSWMRQVDSDLAKEFVHGCFSKQPTADDFEIMLSFNMMVPPKVRAGLGGRPLDATEIMSKLKLPVLVTHGAEDRNSKVGAAKYTASVIPGAKLSIYEGIGHAPFYEDATRFNTELTSFVREANKTN